MNKFLAVCFACETALWAEEDATCSTCGRAFAFRTKSKNVPTERDLRIFYSAVILGRKYCEISKEEVFSTEDFISESRIGQAIRKVQRFLCWGYRFSTYRPLCRLGDTTSSPPESLIPFGEVRRLRKQASFWALLLRLHQKAEALRTKGEV